MCDELMTKVSLIPPDEKDSGESIANGSNPDTVNSHRSSRWEGQDYIEAYCVGLSPTGLHRGILCRLLRTHTL